MVERSKTHYRAHAAEYADYGVEYRAANAHRRAAQSKVAWAIKRGVLMRPSACEECGKACKPQAHHEDYSKPLGVQWICVSCHRKEHGVILRAKSVLKGSAVGNAKLDESKAKRIKELLRQRIPHPEIARQFGVSKSNVSLIARGKAWNHV